MPQIKNALIRYRIIDKCIRNKYKPFPTKEDLRLACEEALFGSQDGVGICDSTIEKDMFAMKMEHDAPIKYSKRNAGYYYSDPEFSINSIPLTEEDLSAIKFAVNTLTQFRDVDLFKQFGYAIDKIVDRVSIASNPEEEGVGNFVQFESPIVVGGNEYLPILFEAIKNNLLVEFDYASFVTGKLKSRKVTPLLLKEYRNRWYLISFDHAKEDIITFALERLSNLNVTQDHGARPMSFNPEHYFEYAFGITANNKSLPETVVLKSDKIAAKYIISQPFHKTQKVVKEGKNRTTFELRIMISEEFIRTLLSYGGEIEVVAPASLREEIAKRVSELSSLYKI